MIAKECLDIIHPVIERQIKDQVKKAHFLELSGEIKERASHTMLNLAVIGQFSSGKSSFINALLRRNLLKVKNEATTAAATFIRKGDQLAIHVTFSGKQFIRATEKDNDELFSYFQRFHSKQSLGRRDFLYFIELLTSNQQVADTVTHLELFIPDAGGFFTDITVIDTPGLFAGAGHASTHGKVTVTVLEGIADLAIVLLPSNQAISASLIAFLADIKPYLLDRCVFIISGMDRLDTSAERARLFDYTKAELKRKLSISNPVVFGACSVSMLPGSSQAEALGKELVTWQTEFRQLEETLKENLARNRQQIISEKLTYLTRQLAEEVGNELSVEQQKLESAKRLLQAQSADTIQEVLGGQLAEAKKRINGKKDELLVLLDNSGQYIDQLKSSASRKVYSAGSGIYSSYLTIEDQLKGGIREEIGNLLRYVNAGISELGGVCRSLDTSFEKQFQANYQALPFLQKDVPIMPIGITDVQLPAFSFSSFKDEVVSKKEARDNGGDIGLWAGLIGGFLVGGPLGALIGAAAGRGGGRQIAQESLDSLQPRLIRLLNEEINKCFKKSADAIGANVKELTANTISAYEALVNDHVKSYGSDIQQVINHREAQMQELEEQIRRAIADSNALTTITNRLKIHAYG